MNKQDLRIVFFGTPEFAVESLRTIVDGGYNVVGVVTMPDKPAGRGHKMFQSPVKQFAEERGLRLMQPVSLKDPEFVSDLRSLNAGLFVVIAFRMLPEVVWTMPPLGTFNLHASLLPRYRGAAPINRAVMNGDTETGVTTFFLKHEIDTGDIIDQERIEITPEDNAGSVHDRLMEIGARLTLKTIAGIIDGTVTPIAQDKLIGDTIPTPAPKIFKEDCMIDWSHPALEIHNQVRGLSPYPGAWTDRIGTGTTKIFETRLTERPSSAASGTLVVDGDRLFMNCGDYMLEVLSLQPQSKRRMSAPDFIHGNRGTK
ncbi:MAG: methionyl-tRNA formyltransferase [Muribaculaceae bacterium]|nr:methionyl-tRNA formyltransferase [Muribaculaceae bacterium]